MERQNNKVMARKAYHTIQKVNSVAKPALDVAGVFGVPGASAASRVLTGAELTAKAARRFV
jgi:hypothetical protein